MFTFHLFFFLLGHVAFDAYEFSHILMTHCLTTNILINADSQLVFFLFHECENTGLKYYISIIY